MEIIAQPVAIKKYLDIIRSVVVANNNVKAA
jgi:hypothetical protein